MHVMHGSILKLISTLGRSTLILASNELAFCGPRGQEILTGTKISLAIGPHQLSVSSRSSQLRFIQAWHQMWLDGPQGLQGQPAQSFQIQQILGHRWSELFDLQVLRHTWTLFLWATLVVTWHTDQLIAESSMHDQLSLRPCSLLPLLPPWQIFRNPVISTQCKLPTILLWVIVSKRPSWTTCSTYCRFLQTLHRCISSTAIAQSFAAEAQLGLPKLVMMNGLVGWGHEVMAAWESLQSNSVIQAASVKTSKALSLLASLQCLLDRRSTF